MKSSRLGNDNALQYEKHTKGHVTFSLFPFYPILFYVISFCPTPFYSIQIYSIYLGNVVERFSESAQCDEDNKESSGF